MRLINSIIGTEHVAKSPADGYVLLATLGTHYATPFLAKNVSFDPAAAGTKAGAALRYQRPMPVVGSRRHRHVATTCRKNREESIRHPAALRSDTKAAEALVAEMRRYHYVC